MLKRLAVFVLLVTTGVLSVQFAPVSHAFDPFKDVCENSSDPSVCKIEQPTDEQNP